MSEYREPFAALPSSDDLALVQHRLIEACLSARVARFSLDGQISRGQPCGFEYDGYARAIAVLRQTLFEMLTFAPSSSDPVLQRAADQESLIRALVSLYPIGTSVEVVLPQPNGGQH